MREVTECLCLPLPLHPFCSKELKANHPALFNAATIITITTKNKNINMITHNPFVISKTEKCILTI
jgi:hypothetical protein